MFKWPKSPSAEELFSAREKKRSQGQFRYILIHGVLLYGTLAFLIDLIVGVLIEHQPLSVGHVFAKAVQWFLAGLIFGFLTWYFEFGRKEPED